MLNTLWEKTETKFLIALIFLLITTPVSHSQNSVGNISEFTGSCTIERGGKKIDASLRGDVFIGDIFEVGDESAVTIKFVDATEISLGEGSYLEIDEFVFNPAERKNVTKILKGKMRATINTYKDKTSTVEFKTANAVAGVKGTILYIDADKELFSVKEGVVALRSTLAGAKPVILKAGQFSRLANGIPQTPRNVTNQMWREFDDAIDRNIWDKLPPEAGEIKRRLPKIKKPKIF